MRGSLRKLGEGRWQLRVYLGVDAQTGKKRQLGRVFHGSKAAADDALRELVNQVRAGGHAIAGPGDPDDPLLGDWLEAWYARESPNWSPTSAATARTVLDVHLLNDMGQLRLTSVRLRDVEQWIHLLRDRGLAPATQIRYFGVLRSALEQAERWELIARNPAARAQLPRVRYEETHIPTAAELVEALQAAPTIHHRTLIWLAAATGARRGQLVAVRWSDFDIEGGYVVFHRAAVKIHGGATVKEPKGGRPIRAALDEATIEVLAKYRRHRQEQALAAGVGRLRPSSYVFARDVHGDDCWYPDRASKMWDEVRSARDEHGELLLASLQGVRLHDLRHAHATLLIAAGVDRKTIAGRLGHAQLSTTDRYTHPVTEADRAAAEIMGRLLTEGA